MTPAAGSSRPPARDFKTQRPPFDVYALRAQFPILHQQVHGKPLVYLDSAATSQKPLAVIESIDRYYREYNANVHRGLHHLSSTATTAYERARVASQRFINAGDAREIVFVRGTTEAINLVAQAYARPLLKPGDEVLITHMEHHSNIVPWQMVCAQTGATLKVAPINDRGELNTDALASLITGSTKVISVVHVSNALGTINDVRHVVRLGHKVGAVVMIDGAQAAPHMPIDVREVDCDFCAFSSHKMFGPTGIGVLFGRAELLERMPPYQGGGEMIKDVTFEKTTYNDLPYKFEAGTPHIAGAIGLSAAIEWMSGLDWGAVASHEQDLLEYGAARLQEVKGLGLVGTAAHKAAVLTFAIQGQHPYEIGQILDHQGVAIRTGHHCAQPVHDFFGLSATCRASLALYNTREDIDALVAALHNAARLLA